MRGDVSQFDDVMAVMTAVKPNRVVNLAYYISSDLPPRVAFKLNILGMNNLLRAARARGCNRVGLRQFSSGQRRTEILRPGASSTKTISSTATCNTRFHKIFNEWLAQDYREKTRHGDHDDPPANVTGPDKVVGSRRSRLLHHQPGARQARSSSPTRTRCGRDPCRRDRRNLRACGHEGQAGPRHLNTGGQHDQPGRTSRHGARYSSRGADSALTRNRRPRAVRQFHDRQQPGGNGIRHAVPPYRERVLQIHQRSAPEEGSRRSPSVKLASHVNEIAVAHGLLPPGNAGCGDGCRISEAPCQRRSIKEIVAL